MSAEEQRKGVRVAFENNTELESTPEYEAFVDKFKPKKTTDDCYTPEPIYMAVLGWACERYGFDPVSVVRPFYPGGDYESYEYPDGCVVLDNPPFSILSKICQFYLDRGIRFFLFAPSLTAFSGKSVVMRMNHIICDSRIVYENGAVVSTSFVSNLDEDVIAQTAPDLTAKINAVSDQIRAEQTRHVPKYMYPDHVCTAAMLRRYSKYGIDLSIRRADCAHISKLDAQKELKKAVYGSGLLLSERAAAEKAAAEKAGDNVFVWQLSEREKALVASLGVS